MAAVDAGGARGGGVGDDKIGAGGRCLRIGGVAHREPGWLQSSPRGEPHRGVPIDNVDCNHGPDRSGSLRAAQCATPTRNAARLDLWYGVLTYFDGIDSPWPDLIPAIHVF
jgi:hypothetical protein